jgi:hypothetical protein
MCIVYTNCFTICIVTVINKQTNTSLSINEKCNKEFFCKTFINVFDITKKCYKLACIDNVKTCAISIFHQKVV